MLGDVARMPGLRALVLAEGEVLCRLAAGVVAVQAA